jgi:hypothetical protein
MAHQRDLQAADCAVMRICKDGLRNKWLMDAEQLERWADQDIAEFGEDTMRSAWWRFSASVHRVGIAVIDALPG